MRAEKRCTQCGETLSADRFLVVTLKPKKPTHKPWTGLSPECRECRKKMRRDYRERKAAEVGRTLSGYMSRTDRAVRAQASRLLEVQERKRNAEERERRIAEELASRPGVPTIPIECSPEDEVRFWGKAKRSANGCLERQGSGVRYGNFAAIRDGKPVDYRAHRVSYYLSHGPIPDDLLVCHECDNPRCIDPEHLFLGTHQDNSRDMVAKGRGYRQKAQ